MHFPLLKYIYFFVATLSISQTSSTSTTPAMFVYPPNQIPNVSTLSSTLYTTPNNSLTTTDLSNTSPSPSTSLDVLTEVIGQYMTSTVSQTPTNRRKRMIERENGQSLTTMDVFVQLKEKEKAKQRKNAKPPKKPSKTSNAPKKRLVFSIFSIILPFKVH